MIEGIHAIKNCLYRKIILQNKGFTISPSSEVFFGTIKKIQNSCTLTIDEGSHVSGQIIFERQDAHVSIGKNTSMAGSLVCAEQIVVGDDVLIAWGCYIVDHNSHSIFFHERKDDVKKWYNGEKDWTHVIRKPVVIKDKAWIGFNSVILKGVTINEGAIVGAGSVVTKDVPPYTIVAGNPARIIREIPKDNG
jgi:acetyltransferase-like isoleucine patch superfamily enzyme